MKSDPTHKTLTLPVHSVDRLLDADGSPILEPRIHPEATTCLYQMAKEAGSGPLRLEVQVPSADLPRGREVEAAVHSHFQTQAEDAGRELAEVLRKGRTSLVVALLIVAAMILIAEWLQTVGQGRLFTLFGESLVIIGWVTLWTPAEMLLFEHLPIRRKRNFARALSGAEVVLTPAPSVADGGNDPRDP